MTVRSRSCSMYRGVDDVTEPQQIIVRIAPDGAIQAETRGIKGPACMNYIEILEDMLDATTVSSAFTSEYTETANTEQNEIRRDLHQW